MNRRNALLGLGAIATGGGALFGSGAFSSVEAERGVSITLNDDNTSGTNVRLEANSSIANNGSGNNSNQLGIDAGSLNVDATTTYDAVFDLTQNSGGQRLFAVSGTSFTNATVTLLARADINNIDNDITDLSSEYVAIDNGATLTVGLKVISDDATSTTENGTITLEVVEESTDFTNSGSLSFSNETESN